MLRLSICNAACLLLNWNYGDNNSQQSDPLSEFTVVRLYDAVFVALYELNCGASGRCKWKLYWTRD